MLLHLVTYCNFSQHRVYLSPPQTLQDSGYTSHTEKRRSEGEMDNGDKENASPNKNKVKRQSKCSPLSSRCFPGCSQGLGSALEHAGLVAEHDVRRRRWGPVHAQPGDTQQVPAWHRHVKLHAFQSSIHLEGLFFLPFHLIPYLLLTELYLNSYQAIGMVRVLMTFVDLDIVSWSRVTKGRHKTSLKDTPSYPTTPPPPSFSHAI